MFHIEEFSFFNVLLAMFLNGKFSVFVCKPLFFALMFNNSSLDHAVIGWQLFPLSTLMAFLHFKTSRIEDPAVSSL
jgi:hypothetical protein